MDNTHQLEISPHRILKDPIGRLLQITKGALCLLAEHKQPFPHDGLFSEEPVVCFKICLNHALRILGSLSTSVKPAHSLQKVNVSIYSVGGSALQKLLSFFGILHIELGRNSRVGWWMSLS